MHINYKKLLPAFIVIMALATIPLVAADKVIEIVTDQAPKAIGPYSQAVLAGKTLYISGQIAIDPATSKLAGESIEEQTKQVLKNIKAILSAQGLTLENVVRSEVYLKDLSHFKAMNEVYGEHFFQGVKPARQTVQAAKLPMDALIEISCIAYIP